jgi:hypothetical protein
MSADPDTLQRERAGVQRNRARQQKQLARILATHATRLGPAPPVIEVELIPVLVAVSEWQSSRVTIMDCQSGHVWYRVGDGDGLFDAPHGLQFVPFGDQWHLLVVDGERHRVVALNAFTGACTHVILPAAADADDGSGGAEIGQLELPASLAFDASNDMLYVAECGNQRVTICNLRDIMSSAASALPLPGPGVPSQGATLWSSAPPSVFFAASQPNSSSTTPPSRPVSAAASSATAAVCAQPHEAQLTVFGTVGADHGDSPIVNPMGMAVDTHARIVYLSDRHRHCVTVWGAAEHNRV